MNAVIKIHKHFHHIHRNIVQAILGMLLDCHYLHQYYKVGTNGSIYEISLRNVVKNNKAVHTRAKLQWTASLFKRAYIQNIFTEPAHFNVLSSVLFYKFLWNIYINLYKLFSNRHNSTKGIAFFNMQYVWFPTESMAFNKTSKVYTHPTITQYIPVSYYFGDVYTNQNNKHNGQLLFIT
jgi:hypothetical protein